MHLQGLARWIDQKQNPGVQFHLADVYTPTPRSQFG